MLLYCQLIRVVLLSSCCTDDLDRRVKHRWSGSLCATISVQEVLCRFCHHRPCSKGVRRPVAPYRISCQLYCLRLANCIRQRYQACRVASRVQHLMTAYKAATKSCM